MNGDFQCMIVQGRLRPLPSLPEVSFTGFFLALASIGAKPAASGESLKKISTNTDTARATAPGANMPYLQMEHTSRVRSPVPCCAR